MKGLDLKNLEEVSDLLGIPRAEVRKLFEDLEAEGQVFRAKDEISGEVRWFHSKVLEDRNVQ